MRKITAGGLLLLAAIVAWMVLWTTGQDTPTQQAGTRSSQTGAEGSGATRVRARQPERRSDPAATADDRSVERRARESVAPRAPAEEVPEELREEEAGHTLLVVHGRTSQPCPGVRVGFLAYDPQSIEEAEVELELDADPFDLLERRGRVLASGPDGKVRLPRFPAFAFVGARHGELSGIAWLSNDPSDEPTLELHPTVPLRALVVDADGRPCGGVGVLLVERAPLGEYPISQAISSAANGEARFLDVDEPDEGDDRTTYLTVAVPITERPAVDVDLRDPPRHPVRVVLPATGTVLCEVVDARGAPVTGRLWAGLTLARGDDDPEEDDYDFHFAVADVRDGLATFTHVGLGTKLEVTLSALDDSRVTTVRRFDGPGTRGEEVIVRVAMGGARPVITGRLVDPEGNPVAGTHLLAKLLSTGRASGFRHDAETATDEEGRFRFVLDKPPGETAGARLRIGRRVPSSWNERGIATAWSEREIAALDLPDIPRSGELDLGDVTFAGAVSALAGKLVDGDGRALAGAVVRAMEHDYGVIAPEDDVDACVTCADGRFRLRGTIEGSQVRVGVSLAGYYLEEEPVFPLGSEDVTVVMSNAAGLAGSVRIPAEMNRYDVRVLVQGEIQRNSDACYRFDDEGLEVTLEESGRFEIRTLRPGVGRVQIRVGHNADDAVLTVDDVKVAAGEVTRDPRLKDVDLDAHLSGITVTAMDTERRPMAGASVHFRPTGRNGFWKAVATDADGRATIHMRTDSGDLMVRCEGYRSALVEDVTGDQTVVLQTVPVSTVAVRLAKDSVVPEPPFEVRVELEWLGTRDPSGRRNWGDPRNVESPSGAPLGTERASRLKAWDPGRYRVTLTLWEMGMGGGSGSGIATVPEAVVVNVPGDGSPITVEIAMDPEEYERRVERSR